MLVSIIVACRNRANFLARVLEQYTRLTYKDLEIVVVDHNSDEPIVDIVNNFTSRLPVTYCRLNTGPEMATPANTWNFGFTKVTGKFVIVTGADILLPDPDTVEKMLAEYTGSRRISVLTHMLTKEITNSLDGWDGTRAWVQNQPGYWDVKVNGEVNRTRNLAGLMTYFTGQSLEQWNWFGKFRTDKSQLTADQDVVVREACLGRGVDTVSDCVAFHQWHPAANVPSTGGSWIYNTEAQARLLERAERMP